ncbi:MAG: hypothetical protein ACKVWV_09140 [Planctomycetota bacterium]
MKITTLCVSVFALATLCASPVRADGFTFHLGKHGRHGSFGISWSPERARAECAPREVWVPGCYESVVERVWVPRSCERVWAPPIYATRYDCHGRPQRVCTSPGRWQTVERGGRYEHRTVKVWRPAHWSRRAD